MNIQVFVLVVGGHLPPIYPESHYIQTENECKKACNILGVKKLFLKNCHKFNEEPIAEFNKSINDVIVGINPELIMIHFRSSYRP